MELLDEFMRFVRSSDIETSIGAEQPQEYWDNEFITWFIHFKV